MFLPSEALLREDQGNVQLAEPTEVLAQIEQEQLFD